LFQIAQQSIDGLHILIDSTAHDDIHRLTGVTAQKGIGRVRTPAGGSP
jgi:hypothetical protein